MQQSWFINTFKGDRAIWGLVVLFMFYSLLAVYSSSSALAFQKYGGDTTYFLRTQFIMLAICIIIIVIVHHLPYRIYFSLSGLFLACAVVLLILTFIFGARINEASRFLEIPGTSFRIQTSDVAKLALVIYLARSLTLYQSELNNFTHVTKYFMLPVALVCGLIMPENLSTAAMIFAISLIIMFIGRIPFKFLLSYAGMAVAGILFFAMILVVAYPNSNRVEVWKKRIEMHVYGTLVTTFPKSNKIETWKSKIEKYENQDADFQLNQAKIAISTGGLFGKAPGKSSQRNLLPQSNSDFIFAIIIEEYGLLFGAIPLIFAYMILLFRGIIIARRCETAFPAYLVMGLIIMISVQAMLNMLVAVGLFPVTGQTLPMVSWGRTSALVMSFSIGAILSVSRVVNARTQFVETRHATSLQDEETIEFEKQLYEPSKA
jgi:cell division protein FtsW